MEAEVQMPAGKAQVSHLCSDELLAQETGPEPLRWGLGFEGVFGSGNGFTDPLGGDSPAAMMRYMAKHH